MSKTVAIITVNYNSSDETLRCIASIVRNVSRDIDYEIVIVDNASTAVEYRKLRDGLKGYSNVRLIANRINVGFASGNMLGVQFSAARYYFFLNNDTELLNDAVSFMLEYAEENSDAGIVTAQLYNQERKKTVSFNFFPSIVHRIFGNGAARFLNSQKYLNKRGEYTEPIRIDIASGSCMFVRGSVFEAVGGMDTAFFLYCEEEDLCKRVSDEGYCNVMVPQAQVLHYEGGSTVRSFEIEREYMISYFMLLDKHHGFFPSLVLKIAFGLKWLRRGLTGKEHFGLFLFVLNPQKRKFSLKYRQQFVSLRETQAEHVWLS